MFKVHRRKKTLREMQMRLQELYNIEPRSEGHEKSIEEEIDQLRHDIDQELKLREKLDD